MVADTLNVNNVPFLTSMSNHMHHGTYNAIDNLKAISFEEVLKNVIRHYTLRGFKIVVVLVDTQLKCLKDQKKHGVPVNVGSREEHAKKIERFYMLIEERGICYYAMLPFNTLFRMMVVNLMITVMFYINTHG